MAGPAQYISSDAEHFVHVLDNGYHGVVYEVGRRFGSDFRREIVANFPYHENFIFLRFDFGSRSQREIFRLAIAEI